MTAWYQLYVESKNESSALRNKEQNESGGEGGGNRERFVKGN